MGGRVWGWSGSFSDMLRGVIFDFHNTLVTARSLEDWLRDCGADEVTTARVLPVLASVWQRAAQRDPDTTWDLDPAMHRQVFTQVLVEDANCPVYLAERLYQSMPEQWVLVAGVKSLLGTLHTRGVKVALLSNIAIDPRARLGELGLLQYLDAVVLSYEEGLTKPDPVLFERTLARLGVGPHECVMIGDSPLADGGASRAGIASIVIPVVQGIPDLTLATQLLTA